MLATGDRSRGGPFSFNALLFRRFEVYSALLRSCFRYRPLKRMIRGHTKIRVAMKDSLVVVIGCLRSAAIPRAIAEASSKYTYGLRLRTAFSLLLGIMYLEENLLFQPPLTLDGPW